MSNITFNGVDLSLIAEFQTPQVRGPHDLVPIKTIVTEIPGREWPEVTDLQRDPRPLRYHCVVRGSDHADLVTKLGLLKGYLSPALGFCALTTTDKSGKRIMARSRGFSADFADIPYLTEILEFDVEFDRYPFWEDVNTLSVEIAHRNLLSYTNAAAATGYSWAAKNAATLSLDATTGYPSEGQYALKVITDGTGVTEGVIHPSGTNGVVVYAGVAYAWSVDLLGAAAGQSMQLGIDWYTAAGVYISSTTQAVTVGTTRERKICLGTSPGTAAYAAPYVATSGTYAYTWWQDAMQFEQAAAASAFSLPPAGSSVYNGGQVNALPTYTITFLADTEGPIWFSVNGEAFTYGSGLLLLTGDVVVVETDLPDVTRNSARDFAHTDSAAFYPLLAPGLNAVGLSLPTFANFTLTTSFRQRYE